MKAKKILSLVLIIVLVVTMASMLGACNKDQEENTLRVALPDGTPLLTMANVMDNPITVGGYKLDFNVVDSSLIGTEITGEKADVAIMPTNAIANLYAKGADYKIVTSNVFGVLYLIGNADESFTLDKLIGKVVYSIGLENTPQLVLEKVLKAKLGEDKVVSGDTAVSGKVAINYVTDGQQVMSAVKNGNADYGLVGEPAATNSVAKGLSVLYDLQEGWSEVTGSSNKYPQASLVVKSSLAKDKDFINALVEVMTENLNYISDSEKQAGLTELFKGYGSSVAFPAASISKCNIDVKWAIDIKSDIESYLAVFGMEAPDEGFYYVR
ncbi:MAG: hypothetical protein ACI4MT_01445 [Christensenellales bacterium]